MILKLLCDSYVCRRTAVVISVLLCSYWSNVLAENIVQKENRPLSLITLYPEIPFAVDANLAIKVQQIVEEWVEPNRRSIMFVSLEMQTSKGIENIQLTSDEPKRIWRNYTILYLGGWRDEVRLQLTRTE